MRIKTLSKCMKFHNRENNFNCNQTNNERMFSILISTLSLLSCRKTVSKVRLFNDCSTESQQANFSQRVMLTMSYQKPHCYIFRSAHHREHPECPSLSLNRPSLRAFDDEDDKENELFRWNLFWRLKQQLQNQTGKEKAFAGETMAGEICWN